LLTAITGVSFDEAWAARSEAELEGTATRFIGLAELIRNKERTGRAKDLGDAEADRPLNRRRCRAISAHHVFAAAAAGAGGIRFDPSRFAVVGRQDLLLVVVDRSGVLANVAGGVNAAGQLLEFASFNGFERSDADLGGLGNLSQGNAPIPANGG
jgi:hypothetical protein